MRDASVGAERNHGAAVVEFHFAGVFAQIERCVSGNHVNRARDLKERSLAH